MLLYLKKRRGGRSFEFQEVRVSQNHCGRVRQQLPSLPCKDLEARARVVGGEGGGAFFILTYLSKGNADLRLHLLLFKCQGLTQPNCFRGGLQPPVSFPGPWRLGFGESVEIES